MGKRNYVGRETSKEDMWMSNDKMVGMSKKCGMKKKNWSVVGEEG